jgi:pimeloyl-ACP methyl ester carboxylesterase
MQLTRNTFLRRGAAAGLALAVSGALAEASSAATRAPDAPHLPPGFSKTFTSRFVNAGGLRQHIVIGGDGPPLLLVHGWPENWYQYRALMPALARDYTVIAVDQRGMGLTEKPTSGYDSATLANDLVALMDELGHERFSVVGLDTGMVISYALAADHPERVARLVVGEAPLPGVTIPRPLPLFLPGYAVPRLFHLSFNRLDGLNEQLVRGREDVFFGYVFDAEAAIKLPGYAVKYYAHGFASSPAALRGSFGFYRAWDATTKQNEDRQATKLTMPVLAIGGEMSSPEPPELLMQLVANDVHGVMLPGAGHFVAEEAPEQMLAALRAFLTPDRDGSLAREDAVVAPPR